MNRLSPIYTEPTNCQDCYKCVRQCPVKAVRISGNKASVIDDNCIYCGHCVQVCPTGAKRMRSDTGRVKELIASGHRVFLSIAPSYAGEFNVGSDTGFLKSLYGLGFEGVSETALGAQEVSSAVSVHMASMTGGIAISTACPTVVELVRQYYPQHTSLLTPFFSPLLSHAVMLKKIYGDDIKVVFAGPCISKKCESDSYPGLVDCALTFKELADWMATSRVGPDVKDSFVPYQASNGTIYPVEGGMTKSLRLIGNGGNYRTMSFSGIAMVRKILDSLHSVDCSRPLFLELLACEGGCVNGSGSYSKTSVVDRISRTEDLFRNRNSGKVKIWGFPIGADFPDKVGTIGESVSEESIHEALLSVGKKSISDELNCSGCGYDTCRDFAKALVGNRAEPSMCVSYMRKVAHDKAAILLQKIPSGVVIVDDNLRIVEMNSSFAVMMGEETRLCFDVNPGLNGMDAEKVLPFSNVFKTVLRTGNDIKEMAVSGNGMQYQLSVFGIQKFRLVAGILQNLNQPQFRADIIARRAREVISKNVETARQIACLLGETAAFTDSVLNSIIDPNPDGDA